ncbi:MAG: MMPL family transporter [Myxococcales bacterium]|nr:MMPL family transporter [Myxococcales bacterium]
MAADPQASAGRRGRRIAAAVVGLVIAGILALVIALRWSVTTDITHFLADQEDAELAAISSQLADSELTRAWIISVGGGDEDEVLAAARELGERLAAHPEVKWIQRGIEGGGGEAFYDLYFPRRLYFVSDRPAIEIPAKISDAGLAEAAQGLLRELSLPQATLIKEIAASDPLLIFPAIVRRLAAAESGGLRPVGDQLLSEDGHALIFLSTVHSPFDGAAMAPLAAAIGEATAAVNADHGGRLTFEESALARHALAAEASIRGDVTRISTISTIGLVLLFLVMFRAPRLVLLVMLPLAYGVLAALAATLALFGSIHGLTLAFGATLIGVAIDYSVHLFNHHMLEPDPAGPEGSVRRIWPGLLLGALTTIAGFVGLAWTSFPGLREIAVFACVGVAAALLSARLLLPPLMPWAPTPGRIQRLAATACERLVIGLRRRRRAIAALLLVALAVSAVGLSRVDFVDDIRAFSQIDEAILAEDERVRGQVSRMDAGRFVITIAGDEEAALQANDAVAAALGGAREAGELAEFRSLHDLIWSRALQEANLAALRSDPRLPARLDAAFAAAGFRPGALAAFSDALVAPQPPPLGLADLEASPLQGVVRSLKVDLGGRVGLLTLVRGVKRPEAIRARLQGIDGVHYFDQGAMMAAAYARYRERTIELVLVGLLLVLTMIAARYRRVGPALAAFLPAVLAAALTVATLALAGAAIHLLHVVALLLVLSMGVDYGVFLVESRDQVAGLAASVLSVVIAALSTILAFGLLGMSTYPALHALGATIGLGVLYSLILAPLSLSLLAAPPPEDRR